MSRGEFPLRKGLTLHVSLKLEARLLDLTDELDLLDPHFDRRSDGRVFLLFEIHDDESTLQEIRFRLLTGNALFSKSPLGTDQKLYRFTRILMQP